MFPAFSRNYLKTGFSIPSGAQRFNCIVFCFSKKWANCSLLIIKWFSLEFHFTETMFIIWWWNVCRNLTFNKVIFTESSVDQSKLERCDFMIVKLILKIPLLEKSPVSSEKAQFLFKSRPTTNLLYLCWLCQYWLMSLRLINDSPQIVSYRFLIIWSIIN